MKTKVTTYNWTKSFIEKEVELPEKTLYFWHNGERIAYSVKPIWTTWNKEHHNKEEEIWTYHIVEVSPTFNRINHFHISVSGFGDILKTEKSDYYRLIDNLLFHPEEGNRTKEQFMADYNRVLEKITESL